MSFLGIKIPNECGRLLSTLDVAGEKESPSSYHITLLHFEDNFPIPEIAKALETTYDIISKIKPFTITVNTIGCFKPKEDKPVPIIAKIKSDDLSNLRKKLADAFDKCNIDFSKRFPDFKPHITLSYADELVDDYKIDSLDIAINEVVLWGGNNGEDRVFITFPFKISEEEKQKHSSLLNKIDIFYKLASILH